MFFILHILFGLKIKKKNKDITDHHKQTLKHDWLSNIMLKYSKYVLKFLSIHMKQKGKFFRSADDVDCPSVVKNC